MNQRWSSEEDDTLRRAVKAGEGIASIMSLLLGRSETAIRTRMRRIGVEPRAGARTGCRSQSDCKAVGPLSLCRGCKLAALRSDPAIEARRVAAVGSYHARPAVKRALAERIAAVREAIAGDPIQAERRREHGRRQFREFLSRPDVRARNMDPETRRRAGAKVAETRLAAIPLAYRAQYRVLIRSKRMLAAEARARIAEIIAEDARRAIAEFDRRQRERAERERREAY